MTSKQPEIRFEGFSGDWEEKKLGEVSDIVGGGTPSTTNKEYWNGNINWFSPGEIGEQIYVNNSQIKITELGLKKSSAKILPIGTVLFTSRAGIGNAAILEKQGCTNQGFQSIIPHENELDSYFIFSNINELKRYGETNGAGSTFIEVSGKQMSKMSLFLPNILEQKKIGHFFSQLDESIALQQRKIEALKEQKKAFLQKMFPKEGATVPEVRFEGFSGEWEERRLEEISNKVVEKNKDKFYSETLTNSAEYGIMSQRDFFDKDISNKKSLNGYYIVRENDFVYNPRISHFAPVGPIKRNKLGRAGVMSPLYYVFRTNSIDEVFLEHYFDSSFWHKFMKLNGDSGARSDRFAIKDSIFKTMDIPYPNIEEQQKIGNFFKQLDDVIALNERELELLKETKKGFLQKLFV